MKAILEFDLPEENSEHRHAVNGQTYAICIWEIDKRLREMEKYEEKDVLEIDKLRELIREILEENGITFDSIVK